MEKIDKDSLIPIYYQLEEIFIKKIESEELIPHQPLPSERLICEKYDISRTTVRQAFQDLENSGYIYKIRGKGTFVADRIIEFNISKFYSFSEEMKKIGKKPSSKILNFEKIIPDPKISRKLQIKSSDYVFVLKRIRYADGEAISIEQSYIPYFRYKDLDLYDLSKQSLYSFLIENFNSVFLHATEKFRAVATNEEESNLLNYPIGAPSILIERVVIESSSIIYSKAISRGDKFSYSIELNWKKFTKPNNSDIIFKTK